MGQERTSRPLSTTLVGVPAPSAPRRARRRFSGPIRGRELRKDIEQAGAAFLDPHLFSPEEAFRALVIVLHSYALGSRTARRLMEERRARDVGWSMPSRDEAFEVITNVSAMRQYLPHLLGHVMASPGAVCA